MKGGDNMTLSMMYIDFDKIKKGLITAIIAVFCLLQLVGISKVVADSNNSNGETGVVNASPISLGKGNSSDNDFSHKYLGFSQVKSNKGESDQAQLNDQVNGLINPKYASQKGVEAALYRGGYKLLRIVYIIADWIVKIYLILGIIFLIVSSIAPRMGVKGLKPLLFTALGIVLLNSAPTIVSFFANLFN